MDFSLENVFVLLFFISSADSQPLALNDEEGAKVFQTQSTTTEVVDFQSSFMSNNVLIILLLTMVLMIIFAACAFCYNCYFRKKNIRNRTFAVEEPNAPNQQQLQDAFDCRRREMLEEPVDLGFTIFQSQSSSFHPTLSRWASVKHLPDLSSAEQAVSKSDKHQSYGTTPRSVFTTLSRKWSDSSAKRIERLRTRLVARFPSVSSQASSDISVWFSASSRNSEKVEYSQLTSEEDKDLNTGEDRKSETTDGSNSKCIPTIVIEFVE